MNTVAKIEFIIGHNISTFIVHSSCTVTTHARQRLTHKTDYAQSACTRVLALIQSDTSTVRKTFDMLWQPRRGSGSLTDPIASLCAFRVRNPITASAPLAHESCVILIFSSSLSLCSHVCGGCCCCGASAWVCVVHVFRLHMLLRCWETDCKWHHHQHNRSKSPYESLSHTIAPDRQNSGFRTLPFWTGWPLFQLMSCIWHAHHTK